MVTALVAVFGSAALSPVLGYSAAVRERMMVRNLAPPRLGDSIRPVVARDVAPGAGIFEYREGPVGYGWPLVAVGPDSAPYNIAVLDSSGYFLGRTRMATWGVWDSVFGVADSGSQPMFETHDIASSPVSSKVCITWVRTDTGYLGTLYLIGLARGLGPRLPGTRTRPLLASSVSTNSGLPKGRPLRM